MFSKGGTCSTVMWSVSANSATKVSTLRWMKWFEDGFHQNYWKNYEKTAVEFQIWGCLGMNMQHSSGRVGTASWQDLLVARSQLQVQDVHYEATTISVVPEGFLTHEMAPEMVCQCVVLYVVRAIPFKGEKT